MSILSLVTQGTSVSKNSRRLVVKKEETILKQVPLRKLDGILAFGNINFSNPAMAMLSRKGISLSLLSFNGQLKGQIVPFHTKNLDLRYLQYEITQNELLSLDFAREFIFSKLNSAIAFFKENRKAFTKNDKIKILSQFDNLKHCIGQSEKYNSLLGYEANISKIHFNQFSQLLKSDLSFEKRSYHPPKDEINSLMSFTYTLMTSLINSFVFSVGLDTYAGYLHKLDYGRPSLSLDILEIYKHSVLNRFVLNLCNKKMIKKEDFENNGYGFYLNNNGKKVFLNQWCQLIHKEGGIVNSLEDNIKKLIKAIRNKKPPKLKGI